MNIVLNNNKTRYLEIFCLENLDNIHEIIKKNFSMKGPLEAKIYSNNESITINKLSKLKNHLENLDVISLSIYSNDRKTIFSWEIFKNMFNLS